jgi:predicted RNA-binding Zn-ribbon protein involved in translation (DUF1610 family)
VTHESSENGQRWQIILLIVLVVAAAGAAWRAAVSMRGEQFEQRAVACAHCGYEGALKVSASAPTESWPRECPQCHEKQLYLYRRCPACGKPILLKDPKEDKYGYPTECPHCKAQDWSRKT